MQDLRHFFAARHFIEDKAPGYYDPLQWGSHVRFATAEGAWDWEDAEIVIIGCGERRGEDRRSDYSAAPDAVREAFYRLYCWHPDVKIFDAGNILQGKTLEDTRAALRMVLAELWEAGKTALVIGGSHDLTLQQYEAFKSAKQMVTAAVVDSLINLEEGESVTAHSFLMELLTGQPNYVRHYSHLGFQSYYIQPRMLETLDKLRFDFTRVGTLRSALEEAEPTLRSADLFSFDLAAIRYPDAICNTGGSPNGLHGDEACALMRYAGMSSALQSMGIYGFNERKDQYGMTAELLAQMLWYFMDGRAVRAAESPLTDRDAFSEYHVSFTSNDVTFLKSRRTARWWMSVEPHRFVPCSYADYLQACKDEIPERWMREHERLS